MEKAMSPSQQDGQEALEGQIWLGAQSGEWNWSNQGKHVTWQRPFVTKSNIALPMT